MLTDFNRIYPIEIEINNLKHTYNTKAVFTVSDLHTSTLLVKIKESGLPFKLNNCIITALFSCVDSQVYKQDATILDPDQGIVGIDLKQGVLQSGTNSMCLKIISNSTDIMFTPNMTYDVVNTVMDGVAADDMLPLMEQTLKEIEITKVQIKELEKQILEKVQTMDSDYSIFQQNVATEFDNIHQTQQNLVKKVDDKIIEIDNRFQQQSNTITNALNGKMQEVDTSVSDKLSIADAKIQEMENKKTQFDETVAIKITNWQSTIDTKVGEAEQSLNRINLAVDDFNRLVETVTGRLVQDFRYDVATDSLQIVFDNGDIKSVPMVQEIPIATDKTLGGIKIGSGLSILPDGTLNVTVLDSVHKHTNKAELDKITDGKVATWDAKSDKGHTHTKSEITDIFEVENSLVSNSPTNAVSVAQVKLIDDKISDLKTTEHTHTNKAELDKITDGKVATWDAKETIEGSQAKATKSLQDANAYTDKVVGDLVGSAPQTLDTIYEISNAIQQNDTVTNSIINQLANKSDKGHTHTKSEITDMPIVVDGLDSTSSTDVLSANQGKILNEKIAMQQDALSKVHVHTNKAELDKITDGKVATWDAKETIEGSQAKATKSLQDANAYTDAKNTEFKGYVDDKITQNVGRETFVTTVTEWLVEGQLFKTTITHNLNSENLIITCTEKVTKENILVSYRVIDANNVEIINDADLHLDVMIVAGALRKILPTIGAEIDDKQATLDKTWSSLKIQNEMGEKKVISDALDQAILSGAYTVAPTPNIINWIWNSDRMGKVMGLMIPEHETTFNTKTTLDSILNDVETRNLLLSNTGAMDTAMSQYGVKAKFISNIDVVIDMLKTENAKDYILSDSLAVRDILNNVEDFNKFFTEFKANEQMRFNILNSNYPYLREKLNSNQEVLVYYLNYGNNDSFLVFNQLFSDLNALKQAIVRNGLQYSYIEFVFILQNRQFFKHICESGLIEQYIRNKDDRIQALIWGIEELSSYVFSNANLCDIVFADTQLKQNICSQESSVKAMLLTDVSLNKILNNAQLLIEMLSFNVFESAMFENSNVCQKIFTTESLYNQIFSNEFIVNKAFQHDASTTAMFENSNVCQKIFTTESLQNLLTARPQALKKCFASVVALPLLMKNIATVNKVRKLSTIQQKDMLQTLFTTLKKCLSNKTVTMETNSQDSVGSLSVYSESNTIILCALGAWSSANNYTILKDAEQVILAQGDILPRPEEVTFDNINGVAFNTAYFEEQGDGYASILKYKAI